MSRSLQATTLFVLAVAASPAHAVGEWGQEIFFDAFEAADTCSAETVLPDGSTRDFLAIANVTYANYSPSRNNLDISEWDNLWGYNDTISPQVPWRGVGGASPVIRFFPRNAYVGAHFHTPAVPNTYGHFSNPSYLVGPNVTMAISKRCGDFGAYLPTAGCLVRNVPTSDANLVLWKFTTNAPADWCNLQPDSDYFVNITISDPATTLNCIVEHPNCPVGPVSYHN